VCSNVDASSRAANRSWIVVIGVRDAELARTGCAAIDVGTHHRRDARIASIMRTSAYHSEPINP
jgi:hypothetical protein